MSRRRGRAVPAARPARTAPPVRARRASARGGLAAALAVALAAALAWRFAVRPGAAPPAPDPLAGLPPQAILARADTLVTGRHSRAALPLFRRLLALTAGRNAGVHCVYAVGLYNSLFEADTVGGVARPAWRTSAERVACMDECVAHLDSAVALAATAAERAGYEERRALMLDVWGFRWAAEADLRAAAADDPGDATFARRVGDYHAVLADPPHAAWAAGPAAQGATSVGRSSR